MRSLAQRETHQLQAIQQDTAEGGLLFVDAWRIVHARQHGKHRIDARRGDGASGAALPVAKNDPIQLFSRTAHAIDRCRHQEERDCDRLVSNETGGLGVRDDAVLVERKGQAIPSWIHDTAPNSVGHPEPLPRQCAVGNLEFRSHPERRGRAVAVVLVGRSSGSLWD